MIWTGGGRIGILTRFPVWENGPVIKAGPSPVMPMGQNELCPILRVPRSDCARISSDESGIGLRSLL